MEKTVHHYLYTVHGARLAATGAPRQLTHVGTVTSDVPHCKHRVAPGTYSVLQPALPWLWRDALPDRPAQVHVVL